MGKAGKKPCANGRLVRAVLDELPPPNVVKLRGNPAEPEARAQLLTCLVAYCRTRCGGCDITDSMPPDSI